MNSKKNIVENKTITKNSIREILSSNDLSPLKKFGQNFLIDKNLISRIADTILQGMKSGVESVAGSDVGSEVFEIGPGLGSLTGEIIARGYKVKGFEIDKGFIQLLSENYSKEKLEIVCGDALETLFEKQYKPVVVCGNLPYNVGTLLITKILESGINGYYPERMIFLLQKEVAEKFCAKEGDKNFSSLSLLTYLNYNCTKAFDISKEAFFPIPKVVSSLIRFERKKEFCFNNDNSKKDFVRMMRALFANRRKTIKNNLQIANFEDIDNKITGASLTLNKRAEQLNIEDFFNLYRSFFD